MSDDDVMIKGMGITRGQHRRALEETRALAAREAKPDPRDEIIRVLKEALEFYADGYTSFERVVNEVKPPGERARAALLAVEKLERGE
jgi:hypothetical protein